MTRSIAVLALALALAGSDRAEAHPTPYGHIHLTPEQCRAAEASGLFRCVDPYARDQFASKRERDNKMVKDVARIVGLDKDQRQLLHREISKQEFDYHEVLQIARDMFGK